MDTSVHIPDLIQRLDSEDDSVRKMAVFKLQNAIGDPSFADVFIQEGGLSRLRHCALNASGNTLAYTLATCSRLLELDMGWEVVNDEVTDRVGTPLKDCHSRRARRGYNKHKRQDGQIC